MILIMYDNPLEGIVRNPVAVAPDSVAALDCIRHYFTGVPDDWEDFGEYTVKHISRSMGIRYTLQEIRVHQ